MTYHGLLSECRRWLQGRGFQHLPQLCSEHVLNLTECFMPEALFSFICLFLLCLLLCFFLCVRVCCVLFFEAEPDIPYPQIVCPPARRAVSIGISYLRQLRGRVPGCIEDSDTMIGVLKSVFGFQESEIRQLRDDRICASLSTISLCCSFLFSLFFLLVLGFYLCSFVFLHVSYLNVFPIAPKG